MTTRVHHVFWVKTQQNTGRHHPAMADSKPCLVLSIFWKQRPNHTQTYIVCRIVPSCDTCARAKFGVLQQALEPISQAMADHSGEVMTQVWALGSFILTQYFGEIYIAHVIVPSIRTCIAGCLKFWQGCRHTLFSSLTII